MAATVRPDPCQRCGCHVTWFFQCNCGEVHGDVCDNCGLKRGTDVPAKLLKLGETDAVCAYGPVMHRHPSEERVARIDAWHRRLDAMTDAELLAYYEASDMSEEMKAILRKQVTGGGRRRSSTRPTERPS
jgi:hypothetical protein